MTATTRSTQSTAAGTTTLFVALELGDARWELAFTTGVGQRPRRRQIPARDLTSLTREIHTAQRRFGLPPESRVRTCYEAGREGFWLDRWLTAQGIENVVVDASSIEVNRRARRTKTDRLDAEKLLQQLLRWAGGEHQALRVVRVPPVAAEDARHLHRELETVASARTRVLNRITSLLATQGLRWDETIALPQWLDAARGWDGEPVPPRLRARLEREWVELEALGRRRTTIEAERATELETSRAAVIDLVRQLMTVRGIGVNGAWLLVMEIFGWREIRNRRQLAGLTGLAGSPYQSGRMAHEQGISKAGNRHVRWMMVQLAWGWLRYQGTSALSCWYHEQFGRGDKRRRRIGIVALARKLLIALWRYLETGALPDGAVLKPVGRRAPRRRLATASPASA